MTKLNLKYGDRVRLKNLESSLNDSEVRVVAMEPDGGYCFTYECVVRSHRYSLRSTGMMFMHQFQKHPKPNADQNT